MTTTTQPRHHRRAALLLVFLVVSLACSVQAQSPGGSNSPPGPFNGGFKPSMAIIIVVLISAFFFMGFFSIYLRQCSEQADPSTRAAPGAGAAGARSRRGAARGLDPAVIQTFPTLVYADVKEHKIGKGALECAVCLSEFDDEDTLRLLPRCDHVFHPDCIDAWLAAHTTCPVCRANLVPPADPTPDASTGPDVTVDNASANPADGASELPGEGADGTPVGAATTQPEHVAIAIEEPVQDPVIQPQDRMARVESKRRLPWRSRSFVRPPRFPRSHSTGHSMAVVRPGEDCERYTLRLPDHIRRDVMAGKLRRSSSCAAMHAGGEGGGRKGLGGLGEGSSRGGGWVGGRSFKLGRWEWAAKSDRWAFFARTFSMKTPRGDGAAAEGSTRRGEGSTRRGLDGGDAAGEGSFKARVFPAVRSPFDCLSPGGGASGARAGTEEDEASTKASATAKV